MIERYTRPEMSAVWSAKSKFDAYLNVEILNAEALNQIGIVPNQDLKKIKENANYDLKEIENLEKETKHDVIAFTRSVSNSLGEEKRYIHYGLTSTDVVDTAYGLLYKKANQIIKKDVERFLTLLKEKAMRYQATYCIGRTHGIHADITVFGLKFALYYDEMKRNYRRFLNACQEIEVGKISGAVGNYAFTHPEVEQYICHALDLGTVNISTQVLQRDRHANYLSSLVLLSSTIEKMALEIRHLQRTEVGEVREPFSKEQKGSSAMPHKRNPIVSENMCGVARILRGFLVPAYEDIPLWHERDISHSSVERIMMPDATILVDYMYHRYYDVIRQLVVDEKKMLENIYMTNGIIFSQRVLTSLIDKGLSREEAYDLVQPLATKAYDQKKDFGTLIKNHELIKHLYKEQEIDELFDINYYQRNIHLIYQKVFD